MTPIKLNNNPESRVLGPPPGMADCGDLHIVIKDGALMSLWLPTPEELKLLNQGAPVCLEVRSRGMPPVRLSVPLPSESLAITR